MALGEQKSVVYSPESAFLIAREGRAFFRENAISFFRGDTDPGNLTIFQKQFLCFSILLCFISTVLFFSKLCSQLQTCLKEREEWMPADSQVSTRELPLCCFYKLQAAYRPAGTWPERKAICKQEASWLSLLTGGQGRWDSCNRMGREIRRQVNTIRSRCEHGFLRKERR